MNYQLIRDFSPASTLEWAPTREGAFEMELSAKAMETGEIDTVTQVFMVTSRVTDEPAVVNPTNHPLVFLFSTPACPSGSRMRVAFRPLAGGDVQITPFKNCNGNASMNFYLAGLYPETEYTAYYELSGPQTFSSGTQLPFATGPIPEISWNQTVRLESGSPTSQGILLATSAGWQVATDLNGKVMWYNPNPVTYATSFDAGGFLWGFIEQAELPVEMQAIRKVDLLGLTVLETSAARVNEQLTAIGKRTISGFHHEVRTLPDGRIVALASVEQILTDVQGPGDVDVIGDMIIVFDRNLQVEWAWDTFDHLDPSRMAVLGEICAPNTGGCPPFYLAGVANDWTHGNSVYQTPDGHLIFSARHQDWLIKINYANGEGDGQVIWKLGRGGDFTFLGSDTFPWFSHQHDGNYESDNRIIVFDNGNTRVQENDGIGNSRGQVIELDESSRTAQLVLDADLGLLSPAVGSAQRLANGNYHFNAGFVPGPTGLNAFAFEVTRGGQVVSSIQANTLIYRSFRLSSLYSPN